MDFLEGSSEAECVEGNLFPVGLAHLAAQELSPGLHEALQRSFRGSLADYLGSGLYQSRSAALVKWWRTSRSVRDVWQALKGARVERMVIYKEPFLAFAPELAYSALPQARLVYIHRDGRDVADSLVRTYDVLSDEKLAGLDTNEVHLGRKVGDRYVPWWVDQGAEDLFLGSSQYARAMWMWRAMVGRCEAFLNRPDVVASGRILRVRYEDLARDPVRIGTTIANHLELEMTPRMRRHLRTAHADSIGIHAKRDAGEIREAERLIDEKGVFLDFQLAES